MASKNFKILSLDGGGVWSIIQVNALIEMFGENMTGHEVLRKFNLAVANSGGSIVLAGLLLNAKLKEVRAFFDDQSVRKDMFADISTFDGGLLFTLLRKMLKGPRFLTDRKAAALADRFKNIGSINQIPSQRLNDLAAAIHPHFQFLILAYDYKRDRAKYFRSNLVSRAAARSAATGKVAPLLSDAVNASSTAPVLYFDRPARSNDAGMAGDLFWDGGVTGQNNPVTAGVIEALANGADPKSVAVLSIGTANTALPPELKPDKPWNLSDHTDITVADLKKLASAVLEDPPDHASFVSHMMLGGSLPGVNDTLPYPVTPIVRLNPLLAPWPVSSGAYWNWPPGLVKDGQSKLLTLDMVVIDNDDFRKITDMCADWIQGQVRNQPVRMGSQLQSDIGHDTFAAARQYWKTMTGM